jgi:hypothetical protein
VLFFCFLKRFFNPNSLFAGTQDGIAKFLSTDGVYGKAAPDHDEL